MGFIVKMIEHNVENQKEYQRYLEVSFEEMNFGFPFSKFASLIQTYVSRYGADNFITNVRSRYVDWRAEQSTREAIRLREFLK